jgi:hypothetical protein
LDAGLSSKSSKSSKLLFLELPEIFDNSGLPYQYPLLGAGRNGFPDTPSPLLNGLGFGNKPAPSQSIAPILFLYSKVNVAIISRLPVLRAPRLS